MAQISYGTITITDTNDIERIYTVYAKSNTNTDVPTAAASNWKESISEAPGTGNYIWQRTVVQKSGTLEKTYSDPVCLTGEEGTDGKGITSITIKYGTSADWNTQPSSWYDNTPEYSSSTPNYWTQTTINYTSGNPTVKVTQDKALTQAIYDSAMANSIAQSANENANGAMSQVVEVEQHLSVTDTNVSALQTRLKKIWINEVTSGDYVAGTYAASGIEGTTFVENNPSTFGYNTLLRHNQLALRYNTINMTQLSTAALTFYRPTTINNQLVQGDRGLVINADGLKIFAVDKYINTTDTSIDLTKIYYTRSGAGTDESPYQYTRVDSPSSNPETAGYYERNSVLSLDNTGILIGQVINDSMNLHIVDNGIFIRKEEEVITELTKDGLNIYGIPYVDGDEAAIGRTQIASFGATTRIGPETLAHFSLTAKDFLMQIGQNTYGIMSNRTSRARLTKTFTGTLNSYFTNIILEFDPTPYYSSYDGRWLSTNFEVSLTLNIDSKIDSRKLLVHFPSVTTPADSSWARPTSKDQQIMEMTSDIPPAMIGHWFTADYQPTNTTNPKFNIILTSDYEESGTYTVTVTYNAIYRPPHFGFGINVQSIGTNSFGIGNNTIVTGSNQFVAGRYNIADDNAYFIIGNGTSEDNRSNLITINNEGHLLIKDGFKIVNETGNYIELTNEGVNIYKQGAPIAKYGVSTIIGNNNDFHIQIDGTELGFYQASKRVAYISNDQLYITQSVVLQQMDLGIRINNSGLGQWSWKVHANGQNPSRNNLNLKWVG